MKLNEKIAWYRRAAKLSQEELAARVGVSRQAVSKWEVGESAPEAAKLLPLARALGITVDRLLDEGEEVPAAPPDAPRAEAQPPQGNRLGFVGRMIRRWGWLAGVYLSLQGLGLALVGGVARYAFNAMFRVTVGDVFGGLPGGWEVTAGSPGFEGFDWSGAGFPGGSGSFSAVSGMGQVFLTIATVIMAAGILIAVAGAILAVVLKLQGRKGT